jgi:hypothetical protein
MKAQMVSRCIARRRLKPGARWRVGGQRQALYVLPTGRIPVPSVLEAAWPLPPPGFEPLTVQLIASKYTDYSLPAANLQLTVFRSEPVVKLVMSSRIVFLFFSR